MLNRSNGGLFVESSDFDTIRRDELEEKTKDGALVLPTLDRPKDLLIIPSIVKSIWDFPVSNSHDLYNSPYTTEEMEKYDRVASKLRDVCVTSDSVIGNEIESLLGQKRTDHIHFENAFTEMVDVVLGKFEEKELFAQVIHLQNVNGPILEKLARVGLPDSNYFPFVVWEFTLPDNLKDCLRRSGWKVEKW